MLLPALLFARTVKVEVPAAVGVPLMAPVEALSERPAGRVPLLNDHLMGPVPVALKVVKKGKELAKEGKIQEALAAYAQVQ